MKSSLFVLICTLTTSWAHAESAKCKLLTYDIQPVIGIGEKKADAFKDAVDQCVTKRADLFERERKQPVDEERYAALIDSCTQLSCQR